MKIHRYYVAFITCGIMVLSVVLGLMDGFWWEIYNRVGVIVTVFFMLEEKWNRREMVVTLAALLFSNVKTLGIYFFNDVLGMFRSEQYGSDVYAMFHVYQKYYLCAGLLTCFVLLFWITIKNLHKEKRITKQYKRSVIITNRVWPCW